MNAQAEGLVETLDLMSDAATALRNAIAVGAKPQSVSDALDVFATACERFSEGNIKGALMFATSARRMALRAVT